jgi:hypothetical protein
MSDRDLHFLGSNCASHGGGYVTDYQAEGARSVRDKSFIAHHNASSLLRLGAAADIKVDIRLGDTQLLKESGGHAGIIMLASVHKPISQCAARLTSQF